MFLKRATIVTLSSFILSACAVNPSSEQLEKTANLESELNKTQQQLIEQQEQVAKQQTALDEANKQLTESQKELSKVKQELADSQNDVIVKTPSAQDSYKDKTVLGQTEWAYISKAKKNLKARIDTGATTSSLNATDIQRFERDGKRWVRFNITHEKGGKAQIIEAPIFRLVKILQSNKTDGASERPVVKLQVRIGDIVQQSEFTLTDRTHLKYPVLIGRTFMQDVILVDISKEYIHPQYKATDK